MTAIHNMRQTKYQTRSNFRMFKFRVYLIPYTRLFTKYNVLKFYLQYIYDNKNFQIYNR